MKYYLGGPMTGYPNYNFPYFEGVVQILREYLELEVISAHEVDHGEAPGMQGTLPYMLYIKGDLKVLLDCDAVIFLPGWTASKGCNIEKKVARALGVKVYEFVPETSLNPPRIREIFV